LIINAFSGMLGIRIKMAPERVLQQTQQISPRIPWGSGATCQGGFLKRLSLWVGLYLLEIAQNATAADLALGYGIDYIYK
jgi:hypothetical protein